MPNVDTMENESDPVVKEVRKLTLTLILQIKI